MQNIPNVHVQFLDSTQLQAASPAEIFVVVVVILNLFMSSCTIFWDVILGWKFIMIFNWERKTFHNILSDCHYSDVINSLLNANMFITRKKINLKSFLDQYEVCLLNFHWSKNIVLSSLRPCTKIAGRHE